jgi:predicted DNA-binding antitoxin AbrB/MazE fold protein
MPTISAEYHGHVFVPSQPVELPKGTRVEVVVRPHQQLTDEDKRQWQAILHQLDASIV